ncbi:MAG: hypothetical protein EU529_00800 [Promethearchaeota archaeon]|nr:MAG: hypothetical protein EU529_00800 [Candidatus Lokiarchaeota archaeon]
MFYEEKCTLCGECLMQCPYLAYPEEKGKAIRFKNRIDYFYIKPRKKII